MTRSARILGLSAAVLLVLAAVAAPSPPAPQNAPPATAALPDAAQWARDLDVLSGDLPKLHKNLFARLPEPAFRASVADLKAALPMLALDEALVRVLKLVASIGDAHTGIGYRPRAALPLVISRCDDGLWVRNCAPPADALFHGRITAVDGKPVDEVAVALAALIPHENDAQVWSQLPGLLTDPAVLHGLKLITGAEEARFTVRDAFGTERSAEVRAAALTEKPAWLADIEAENAAFRYLRNRQKDYWFEIMPEAGALYFQYNACRSAADRPFPDFVKEMFAAADAAGVDRVIVDLRLNGGGNSMVFFPFKAALKARPALNRKGSVFVLIGRRTFSSALMNAVEMKLETPAVLVGEPTGGKPNHFGEVRTLRLPGSGLALSYSTNYFKEVEGDPPTLEPDVRIEVRFADFLARRDPVLEAALAARR